MQLKQKKMGTLAKALVYTNPLVLVFGSVFALGYGIYNTVKGFKAFHTNYVHIDEDKK